MSRQRRQLREKRPLLVIYGRCDLKLEAFLGAPVAPGLQASFACGDLERQPILSRSGVVALCWAFRLKSDLESGNR